MRVSDSAFTVFIYNGTLSNLTNSGQIQNTAVSSSAGNYSAIGLEYGNSVLTNLINLSGGSITSASGTPILAIDDNQGSTARIVNINNAGTIAATGNVGGNNNGCNDNGSGIYNENAISTLTNTGSIYTSTSGAYGIYNFSIATNNCGVYGSYGSIQTLNNSQGFGNANGALTLKGNLPANYNAILNSTRSYGQLAVNSATGPMVFGISNLSSLTPGGGIYSGVLQGFSTLSGLVSPTSGTYNGYNWSLVADNTISGQWNLVYTVPPTASTNAASAITRTAATLHGTVNPSGGQTAVTFNYGTTQGGPYSSVATATQSPLAAGDGNSAVSVRISGLTCNTTYYFQVSATNSAGTTNGGEKTFTTFSDCTLDPATLSVTNSPQLYTGSPIAAAVSCSSGGAVSNVLYNGSSTVPSAEGTYEITANCAANGGDLPLIGASAGNFLISYSAPASIPSLSEWTQLMLGLMVMMLIGWHFHRERSY
jgi:hypothetical protein